MLHGVVVVEGAIIEDGHGVGDPAVHRLQWLLQIACPQLSAQQDGSSEDLECWPPRRRYAVREGCLIKDHHVKMVEGKVDVC